MRTSSGAKVSDSVQERTHVCLGVEPKIERQIVRLYTIGSLEGGVYGDLNPLFRCRFLYEATPQRLTRDIVTLAFVLCHVNRFVGHES